jgi:hypothetical protein
MFYIFVFQWHLVERKSLSLRIRNFSLYMNFSSIFNFALRFLQRLGRDKAVRILQSGLEENIPSTRILD